MKILILGYLSSLLLLPAYASAEAPEPPPAFRLELINIGGMPLELKVPAQPAPGKPWLWVGEFGGHLKALERGLLAKGWHVAYLNARNQFGSPRAMAAWERTYEELHGKRGLAARPALLGISRGGLYVNAWTRLHPDRVSVLYLDNGVCDPRSWPGGIQLAEKGGGSKRDWDLYKTEFGFTSDEAAVEKSIRPIDGLAPAIKNGVFLISVHGTADQTVPYADNAKPLVELWKKSGDRWKTFPKDGGNHHPHGLPDPAPLIELLCKEGGQSGTDARPPPNVLFLFTDDQQADTIHALGNTRIRTPNMDRLAANGTAFLNAYTMGGSSPGVCLPSRASLLTGRTLWNLENPSIWDYEISPENKTLPEVFRENGFATFATGKNDPGKAGQFGRAYTHGDKLLFQGMSNQYRLPLYAFRANGDYAGEKPVVESGRHSAEVYAAAAIRFLESRAGNEQPFYAYVAFQTPHDPRQSPEEFRNLYRDEEMQLPASFRERHPFDNGMLDIRDEKTAPLPREPGVVRKHIADYFAMITHTDAQIGRILSALEQAGKMDNTIIVFASDNGLALGRHGLMGKQNLYEHSVKVPLIISGPGIPKGETRSQLCYLFDLNPTLCELAGLEIPRSVEFKSLVPLLGDEEAEHRQHVYTAFMSWQRAIRDERYKLIEYCAGGERHTQLFDLIDDPDEMNNLAWDKNHRAKLESLRGLLIKERQRLNDGNSPFAFSANQGKEFWKNFGSP